MLKIDKKYCHKCHRYTVYNYVGSKSDFEDCGFVIRSILAISSLGLTETLCRDRYWKCSKCGEIVKE